MNDDKKNQFRERIAALHEKYTKQLPEKYQDIETSWKDYQSDFSNPDYYETFYRLIHTLKGTAATFGFNKQADICFAIQQILTAINEQSVVAEDSVEAIQSHLQQLKNYINTPADGIDD
ncbi:MAG: Hpt domain-containing protein [Gammaproteobacteria bacterium]|nr:Hpt domain-containing protein [Gammaproteobacteria bacterium]MCW8988839.1 Hpt domain-containing protein [Gammaproteobacteria bacterium]